jgi:hypothetical protein
MVVGGARRTQSGEELVLADLAVFIGIKVSEDAGGEFRAEAGNAEKFFDGQEAVVVLVQFIEAGAALCEDAGADGFLGGGFFSVRKFSVSVGVKRIAVLTGALSAIVAMVAAGALDLAVMDRLEVGLALFFGKLAVSVHVERFEDFRKSTVAERVPGRVHRLHKGGGSQQHC